jgi:3-oxoacyl-[acyl-carrier protein] reductase
LVIEGSNIPTRHKQLTQLKANTEPKMDLQLIGKTALVCGASKGLGYGCAQALIKEGAHVVLAARGAEALQVAKSMLEAVAAHGATVRSVVCDVTTKAGRQTLLNACATPDILITNAAGPPPGDFRSFDEAAWAKALESNLIAPAALIRAVVDGMGDRGYGRILNITSGVVKSASEHLPLSNGARGGLISAVAGLSRQVAARGVTINNLLPGLFATDRGYAVVRSLATTAAISEDEALQLRLHGIPAKRMGTAEEFGALATYLCSPMAGYITGQNLLIDGGAYVGVW